MFDQSEAPRQTPQTRSAKDWISILSRYRTPDATRSALELAITLVPFLSLWALAWAAMSISPVLSVAIALVNAGFLLRLFTIQHDCGHGAFFASRATSDWIGRILGVLTLTPYAVWRRTHAAHHGASGNLDQRGMGDVHTLTVAEYRRISPLLQFLYRVYRHPLVLFGLGPAYLFYIQNRLPLGLTDQPRYWISAMGTTLAIVAMLAGIYALGGLAPILLIFVPTTLLAATAGVWLFYVQHQFEATHWEVEADWDMHDAALHGSSHYVLPPVLQWMSANIGIHHVHHLQSRIPFYRLPKVLSDHAELFEANRMTIRESFETAGLQLWDEDGKRLLSFAQLRAIERARGPTPNPS